MKLYYTLNLGKQKVDDSHRRKRGIQCHSLHNLTMLKFCEPYKSFGIHGYLRLRKTCDINLNLGLHFLDII